MTVLALVRHGQTNWNRDGLIQGLTDIPLNETGLEQAAEAAAALAAPPFDRDWAGVITSPLLRAQVTGQVIASALGIPMLGSLPALTERDYGVIEGWDFARVESTYPDGIYPESEANEAMVERALAAIHGIREEHDGSALVVVAHGGLLRQLLSHVHGSDVATIRNATVNLVEFERDRAAWAVRAVNGELRR